jgi:hypothetical protein
MSEASRRRFTLADLMMLVAVVGLSFGLIMQMIGFQSRSQGCRASCLNNQRQVGLAMLGHLNAHGHFPNSVTWGEPSGGADAGTIILNYERDDLSPLPGASHPLHDVGPLHSWVVDLLPYMDQQSLANDFDRDRAWDSTAMDPSTGISNLLISTSDIGILTCPSDDTTIPGEGNLSYVVNSGFNRWWYSTSGWDGAASPPRTDRTGPIDRATPFL